MSDLVPLPERGRRYRTERTVRLGDAGLDGWLRLDALARFLQDVAAEDAVQAGVPAPTWVVRRTVLDLEGRPRFGERIELTTFCGGLGGRWAERRTTVEGPHSRIEAATLWVFVEAVSGRPAPLPEGFHEAYGEAAGGRRVSGRLLHPQPGDEARRRPWPLRASDFDVLGHVNNAAYFSPVDDELARLRAPFCHGRLELEYRDPIGPGAEVDLVVEPGAGDESPRMWLAGAAGIHASALVGSRRPATTEAPPAEGRTGRARSNQGL
ncbi:MAG: hypothetical protein KY454_13095 [Actinobacteria bacterium]|nr:hypothetical protein [Actinomycetota bacterium]MBW3651930.1 hypothetical protein [Actinomycetota bacterium]